MKQLFKQTVGIDIAKSSFTSCVCRMYNDQSKSFSSSQTFDNSEKGFKELMKWVKTQTEKNMEVYYLLEATGVYYEDLAYYLFEKGYNLDVVLPNKTKNYFKSLNVKSKNDRLDAKYLSQYAAERELETWVPPSPFYSELRGLTRHFQRLQETKTRIQNQQHSNQHSKRKDKFITRSNMRLIKQLQVELKDCLSEIKKHIDSEPEVKAKISLLTTIKGVGFKTAAKIVGETQGFFMINSRQQLISYAGYDVVENQSGSSVKGKTHISKKGNKYIRGAMYFPALSAVRHGAGSEMELLYDRVFDRRKKEMVAYVAVQRKLLALMYTLWKRDEAYDPERRLAVVQPK